MQPKHVPAIALALLSACVAFEHSDELALADETQAVDNKVLIYVSPNGSDHPNNLGLSRSTPLRTLARVNQVLDDLYHFDEPSWSGGDIEVRISPTEGKYYGQSVVWTATNPAYSITFMPLDDNNVRPIFNGCSTSSGPCTTDWFFTLEKGGPTNIHFKYIRIEQYDNGIGFEGTPAADNESNSVYGCYFYQIGNKYTDLDGGVGALNFSGSDMNRVENSHFINIENYPVTDSHLHAIYVSHGADDNYIARNRFSTSTGVAVKLRDNNWRTVIHYNTFSANGNNDRSAGYADQPQPQPERMERSSCQSSFRYNILDGRYDCRTKLPRDIILPSPLSADGDTCNDAINPDTGQPYKRLSTYDNRDDGTQCNND